MLLSFKNHLQRKFPEVADSKILIAVSGGLDSVVLAHLCTGIGLDVVLAHCNFGLRGEESEGDENFVRELGDTLGAEVQVVRFDTTAYARDKKLSIQMAARELRYEWFEELRKKLRHQYIFTAHHANDNLETVLINLVRGTGLDGLRGIPEQNDAVLRPLLPYTRAKLEEYARRSKLEWREDSSNQSSKYLRNRIRNEVIPILSDLNPQLMQNFNNTSDHLRQSSDLVEDYVAALFKRIARKEDFGYSFKISALKTIPHLRAVLYQLFKSFGFRQWEDLYDLLEAQSGKTVYSKTHRLVKDRDTLLLTTLPIDDDQEFHIRTGEEVVMLPMGTFQFEKAEKGLVSGKNVIYLDQEKLQFPLIIRRWKEGDFFYPFGLKGKKKLSKFFKDEKLSLPQKENCWLLCSGGKIVWVIGKRADERFAVDEASKDIIRLTYTP